MKVVIFAGGLGTRLSEETTVKPKPMVEIGEMPILWHIMKSYGSHGLNEFVICLGYKGHVIKEFFANYAMRTSSIHFDIGENRMELLSQTSEPWKVTLVDTGESTMTGGRLKRVKPYLNDETFCLTYGDGVSDVSITELVEFHRSQKTLATLTAVQPPGRFGAIALASEHSKIHEFQEKPAGDGAWVNGGYFVCEPGVIDYIDGDDTVWEASPLTNIAKAGQLSAFRHTGFWHPMDTLRDKHYLEQQWMLDNPAWKQW